MSTAESQTNNSLPKFRPCKLLIHKNCDAPISSSHPEETHNIERLQSTLCSTIHDRSLVAGFNPSEDADSVSKACANHPWLKPEKDNHCAGFSWENCAQALRKSLLIRAANCTRMWHDPFGSSKFHGRFGMSTQNFGCHKTNSRNSRFRKMLLETVQKHRFRMILISLRDLLHGTSQNRRRGKRFCSQKSTFSNFTCGWKNIATIWSKTWSVHPKLCGPCLKYNL